MRSAGSCQSKHRVLRRTPRPAESGNVSLGFVGTLGLLLILVLTLASIALSVYARAVIEDSAAEGARMVALRGGSPALGEVRTRELITSSLPGEYADDIRVRVTPAHAYVDVVAPMPLVGLVTSAEIHVSVSVPMERAG